MFNFKPQCAIDEFDINLIFINDVLFFRIGDKSGITDTPGLSAFNILSYVLYDSIKESLTREYDDGCSSYYSFF